MLKIRQDQIQVLTAERFERWMAEHLSRFFPDRVAAMGEGELSHLIRDGRVRAALHGFTDDSHVCTFLDLMVLLGPRFDEATEHAWAAEILRVSEGEAAEDRIDELYEAAREYLLDPEGFGEEQEDEEPIDDEEPGEPDDDDDAEDDEDDEEDEEDDEDADDEPW